MKKLLPIMAMINLHAIIDFNTSMQLHKYTYKNLPIIEELIPLSRALYEKHNPFIIKQQSCYLIPKLIHHIWMGRPMAQEEKEMRATWEQLHPDWRCILWTDKPENDPRGMVATSWQELENILLYTDERFIVVQVAQLDFENRRFFDASRNYGEKSDILRYEIVYRLGGLYVDCDVECIKACDDLHRSYHFYTGLQPLDTQYAQLGIGIFGACPGHPILKDAIDTIERDTIYRPVVIRSGPIHFTRSFIAQADRQENIDIALPASFFYPRGYNQNIEDRAQWLCPESYAVHHWAGSWMKKEAFSR